MLYNPKAFFTHAAWLHQAFAHCARFPPAADRSRLGRVSVPVWLIVLSDQLWIVALVGHYPTNKLIQRRLLRQREVFRYGLSRHGEIPRFHRHPRASVACGISSSFPELSPTAG